MLVIGILASPSVLAEFSFDEMEEIERAESTELLGEVDALIKSENFTKARSLVNQAIEQTGENENTTAARKKITQAEKKKEERIAAAKAQKQRQNSNTASSSSSSSSGCKDYVYIEFEADGVNNGKHLSVSPPRGVYQSKANSHSVSVRGDCVAGNYNFRYTANRGILSSDVRSYSGSFFINGSSSYCKVRLSEGFSSSINVYCD